MKTVHLSGKQLENYERRLKDRILKATGQPDFELNDLEKRRQPLRDLLVEIDATHWCDWVNAWEPAESTEARSREPRTPLASATPFNLQALDTLAAVTVARRSVRAGQAHPAAPLQLR